MTTETFYNVDAVGAQAEAERDAELEEEQRHIDEEIKDHVRQEMANVSVNLEESDSDDEHDKRPTSFDTPSGSDRMPSHFLTSTPFNPHNEIEEGDLQDTPETKGLQDRFLHADDEERLKILYEARGHKINQLKNHFERIQAESESDNRRLRHDVALLKAENEELRVKLEQSDQAFELSNADNKDLRSEVEMLKNALQKQERSRHELVARAEEAENLVQNLQTQLIDLQRRDVVLKAREQHDAIVSSLKHRHEAEVGKLENEVQRLTNQNERARNELEQIREKLDESRRLHDSILVEKSEKINELNRKLAETQNRLTELIVANSNQDPNLGLEDPVKEICNLKSTLGAVTQQRNEQAKVIQDLSDELAILKLREEEAVNQKQNQREISELRYERLRKDREISELKERNRQLSEKNDLMKIELEKLRDKVTALNSGRTEDQGSVQDLKKQIRNLEEELVHKTEEHNLFQERIKGLIEDWEINSQQIKDNHHKDRVQLEEVRTKYKELRRKVRGYHKHRQKEREHYEKEHEQLRGLFEGILLEYKMRIEKEVENREFEVENEVMSMRRQFDAEIERITGLRLSRSEAAEADPPSLSLSSAAPPVQPEVVGTKQKTSSKARLESSDEENNRPQTASSIRSLELRSVSRQETSAKIFEEVSRAITRDIKDKLKRPHEGRSPLMDRNKSSKS